LPGGGDPVGAGPPGTPHIIGTCGYTRWNQENRFALLGYDLARDCWRRGLMSEAVAAVLRFGFEHMALHRVEATVVTGNTASATLLGRAGFEREGVLRGRFLKRETVWMCRCSASPAPTGLLDRGAVEGAGLAEAAGP